MSTIDDLLDNNARYAAGFRNGSLASAPKRRVAVVACMDARLDVHKVLGLKEGEAHVIRNAGGIITDDVIRSLLLSQRLLGTREILLIHHTDCGMLKFTDDDLRADVRRDVGAEPPFALGSFSDLETSVRQSVANLRASQWIPHKGSIRAFIYDVRTGRLREVSSEAQEIRQAA